MYHTILSTVVVGVMVVVVVVVLEILVVVVFALVAEVVEAQSCLWAWRDVAQPATCGGELCLPFTIILPQSGSERCGSGITKSGCALRCALKDKYHQSIGSTYIQKSLIKGLTILGVFQGPH